MATLKILPMSDFPSDFRKYRETIQMLVDQGYTVVVTGDRPRRKRKE